MRHSEAEHRDLQALSEHLLYEIEMLEHCTSRIRSLLRNQDVNTFTEKDRYVFLESFLLHARTLYEFLFTRKGKDDKNALRANDFMEDDSYDIPSSRVALIRMKHMIDTRLVHLSQHRLSVKESDTDWDVGFIFNEIYQQLLEFFDRVDDNHVCEQLRLRKSRTRPLRDVYYLKDGEESMLNDWNCSVVMGAGSPSVPVIRANPIGFPVNRSHSPRSWSE